jgi:hypothetical protein
LEHGANPNAGADSSGCCLTIAEVYHGERAGPLQNLLREYGARTPPYAMNRKQLQAAIRGGDDIVKHEEFGQCLLATKNVKLFERYLDSNPAAVQEFDVSAGLSNASSRAVRLLLERGLDPKQTDWLGKTLLHEAAEQANVSMAKLFLDAGAEINAHELEFQGTPLAAAVRAAKTDPVDDVTAAGRRGKIIALLLKRGAATSLPGDEPWATPLAWARRNGLPEIEALLVQRGAH